MKGAIFLANDIGVLIADDHLLIRQGLRNLLGMQEGIKVLGEAVDGVEAVDKTLEMNPDVLLLDINMPRMNGIEALNIIKKENPNQKIIILTIHNSKEYIQETINLGADGYVSKNADIAILKDAIFRVHQGETYIQPTIIKTLVTPEDKSSAREKITDYTEEHRNINELEEHTALTSREVEVLKEVANGKTNKEISKTLNISEKTVRNHLYSVFKKIDVSDRTQAALYVVKNNMKYK